ncbi:hypothetical protein ACIQNG_02090 [Streptomyces sp. NPDC091377]|uniref:hypothetical protein n=1 Tax=Streptomyces sp. NPDC091377 TaxID=3365995 RepID=UPI0037F7ED80
MTQASTAMSSTPMPRSTFRARVMPSLSASTDMAISTTVPSSSRAPMTRWPSPSTVRSRGEPWAASADGSLTAAAMARWRGVGSSGPTATGRPAGSTATNTEVGAGRDWRSRVPPNLSRAMPTWLSDSIWRRLNPAVVSELRELFSSVSTLSSR